MVPIYASGGTFVGTKVVQVLGWDTREGKEGYIVQYADGYKSWSPADVFEAAYRRIDAGANFGQALEAMKSGLKVARMGWNGKGMWISLSPGTQDLPAEKFWNPNNRAFAEQNNGKADVLPCITMKTADGKILMGWLASQTDMLAEDWILLP